MKKQRRGLNRYNMLQDGKKRKKVSMHMHDTLKTICEEKNSRKNEKKKTNNNTTTKTVLTGFEPTSTKIGGYSKHERSTYCAIESLENYL